MAGGERTERACVVERVALREERGVEDRGGAEDEEREVERRRAHVPPLEQVEGHACNGWRGLITGLGLGPEMGLGLGLGLGLGWRDTPMGSAGRKKSQLCCHEPK